MMACRSNAGNNSKTAKVTAPSAWSNPTPNAWARPLKTGPPPGLSQPTGAALPEQNGAVAPNPILRERFLYLTLSLVGQRVTVTHTDGTVLEGVFHTATPFADLPADKKNRFVLKAVQVIKGDQDKIALGSTVVVPADKIVSLHCKSLRLVGTSNGKGDAFRTDAEISSTLNDKGRDLVAAGSAWTTGGTAGKASRADVSLGDSPRKQTVALRGNIGEWDQFRANEELFNVQAKFDENLYTTQLDKSSIDKAKIKEAERLAREIETTASTNIHIADERNQASLGNYDEEDRYSGVLTEKLQTRNVDPAPPKKTMNYAAAAAKADAGKVAPSGLVSGKKDDAKIKVVVPQKEEATKEVAEESSSAVPEHEIIQDAPKQNENKSDETDPSVPVVDEQLNVETVVPENQTMAKEIDDAKDKPEGASEAETGNAVDSAAKATTKLNANAKSFTFNPAAKTFTPSFVVPTPIVQTPNPIPQQMIDPITGAPIPPHIPGQQHYMHPMGHPGTFELSIVNCIIVRH